MITKEERKAQVDQELARVRAALPPVGARVLLAEVARRAGLDEETTTRRLLVLCGGHEAALDRGWVSRRKPAGREEKASK